MSSINAKRGSATSQNDREPDEFRIGELRDILLSKVHDPQPDRTIDFELVQNIAGSARTIGIVQPIAVRRKRVEKGSGWKWVTELVAGAHRLLAAHSLGHDRIPCYYVTKDDEVAKLVAIGENLFRKHLTVLELSKLIMAWYRLARKNDIVGQVGAKRLGRPREATTLAALELPLGTTTESRRHILRRANKVDRLPDEVKKAAVKAGLANNQRTLLAIADIRGVERQLHRIKELSVASADSPLEHHRARAADAAKQTISGDRPKEKELSKRADTTFEQLEQMWKEREQLPTLWAYAPALVRKQFIGMLERRRCKAKVDAVQFLNDMFSGRKQILVRDIFAVAKARGLARKQVKHALYGRFKRKHEQKYGSRWYYVNPCKDWKDQNLIITSAQLKEYLGIRSDPPPEEEPAPARGKNTKRNNRASENARSKADPYFTI